MIASPYLIRPEAMDFAPGPHKTVIPTYGACEIAPDGTRRVLCEHGHDSADAAVLCAAPRSTPALARLAIEAYGESTGGLTWDKKPIPPYEVIAERTPHVARAWEAAVAAVLRSPRVRVTRAALVALAVLAGCSAALGTTPAVKSALVVVDVATLVRRYVCARELDPLLGDPRAHPPAADAGSLADVGGAE